MKNGIIVVDQQTPVPAAIVAAGAPAKSALSSSANIRNRNTRLAYGRAVSDFFAWCESAELSRLELMQPVHVAAYIAGVPSRRKAYHIDIDDFLAGARGKGAL
jgi:hypothetical protein